MGRYVSICVECGTHKAPTDRAMGLRCKPCDTGYFAAMRAANVAITTAKARGLLPKASVHACMDCGARALDYDHRDYRKPLEVQPVCRPCNFKRGPALWRESACTPPREGPSSGERR